MKSLSDEIWYRRSMFITSSSEGDEGDTMILDGVFSSTDHEIQNFRMGVVVESQHSPPKSSC